MRDELPELELYEDLVPEESFPIFGLRVVSYVSPEGKTLYGFDFDGSVIISQLIGLLEMVKHDITTTAVKAAHRGEDEDE